MEMNFKYVKTSSQTWEYCLIFPFSSSISLILGDGCSHSYEYYTVLGTGTIKYMEGWWYLEDDSFGNLGVYMEGKE